MKYDNRFKYKVWDYNTTKMYKVVSINLVYMQVEARSQKSDENELIVSFDKRNLLQYSGFKSKDDKDIFKKDIIEFYDYSGKIRRIGVVIEDKYGNLSLHAKDPSENEYGFWHIENAFLRGINHGSIFEFPNLIDERHWNALKKYEESTLLS